MLVAGIDSSTQSTKILLCDAADGTVVAEASAQHPDGTECHPRHWWDALTAAGNELLERADAVAVGAQQHGMVVLDEAGSVIRPAMLWNDVKSAPQARTSRKTRRACTASCCPMTGLPGGWPAADRPEMRT